MFCKMYNNYISKIAVTQQFIYDEKEAVHILYSVFTMLLPRMCVWKSHRPRRARILEYASFTGFQSSEEPLLHSLICSFVMTGRRLVNFNFWFQKLSNTAQMRNQFSQLPWLCGEKNSRHWWTAHHMTESGISSAGPCCHHLNYRLPLVIYLNNISFSDTTHI